MARPSGEKVRAGGRWTQAKFNSFIKNQLRQATRKWPPISDVLREARTKRGFYLCAGCGEEVPATVKEGARRKKNVHVDHEPAVIDPEKGFTTWDECIERMFCEADSLQVLCHSCHTRVTAEETVTRAETMKKRKEATNQCWRDMRQRCQNKNSQRWYTHGGRGIKVCPEWGDYQSFLDDMGLKPVGMTLERIDNDGDYCKDNCKWATPKEQANNRSTCVYITHDGVTLTITQWAEALGISQNSLKKRLASWDIEKALSLPRSRHPVEECVRLKVVEEYGKGGITQKELAEKYGLTQSGISLIIRKARQDEKSKEEAALRAKHRKESKNEQQ